MATDENSTSEEKGDNPCEVASIPKEATQTTTEKLAAPVDCEVLTTQQLPPAKAAKIEKNLRILVAYKKDLLHLNVLPSDTIGMLKKKLEDMTEIPLKNQKLMYKGIPDDDATIKQSNIKNHSKLLLVGSTESDAAVMSKKLSFSDLKKPVEGEAPAPEKLCARRPHSKYIERGVPPDAYPGILNEHDSLPPSIGVMLNKGGEKTRLTFKHELDEVWIGTARRTEKLPMNSIKNIIAEPITGHEHYSVVGLWLGKTESSIYWLYWFPSQFVRSLQNMLTY